MTVGDFTTTHKPFPQGGLKNHTYEASSPDTPSQLPIPVLPTSAKKLHDTDFDDHQLPLPEFHAFQMCNFWTAEAERGNPRVYRGHDISKIFCYMTGMPNPEYPKSEFEELTALKDIKLYNLHMFKETSDTLALCTTSQLSDKWRLWCEYEEMHKRSATCLEYGSWVACDVIESVIVPIVELFQGGVIAAGGFFSRCWFHDFVLGREDDVDFFFVKKEGIDHIAILEKMISKFDIFKPTVSRSKFVINVTFMKYEGGHKLKLQFILREYETDAQVLNMFDISMCKIGYSITGIFCTFDFLHSAFSGTIKFDTKRLSLSASSRYEKYAERLFRVPGIYRLPVMVYPNTDAIIGGPPGCNSSSYSSEYVKLRKLRITGLHHPNIDATTETIQRPYHTSDYEDAGTDSQHVSVLIGTNDNKITWIVDASSIERACDFVNTWGKQDFDILKYQLISLEICSTPEEALKFIRKRKRLKKARKIVKEFNAGKRQWMFSRPTLQKLNPGDQAVGQSRPKRIECCHHIEACGKEGRCCHNEEMSKCKEMCSRPLPYFLGYCNQYIPTSTTPDVVLFLIRKLWSKNIVNRILFMAYACRPRLYPDVVLDSYPSLVKTGPVRNTYEVISRRNADVVRYTTKEFFDTSFGV